MIKYRLICKKCKNVFDSWFSSSREFDRLKKINLLTCSECNSYKIEKSLMSPQIIKKEKSKVNKNYEKKNKASKK